jgi:hypothetical protein
MKITALCGVALTAFFLASSATAGDWVTQEKVDPMTDETKRSALVVNDQGHQFSLYRISEGGEVWANFSLGETDLDTLSGERLPRLRVDKHELVDLQDKKRLTEVMHRAGDRSFRVYEWEPKWINFHVWGGDGNLPAELLTDIMEGETLLIQYYLSTGGSKYSEFTLEGAKPAIAEALQIDGDIDPELLERAEVEREALKGARQRCNSLRGKERDSCNSRLTECMQLMGSSSEAHHDIFMRCME